MISTLRTAVMMLLAFTVMTGGIYPASITGIAQLVFPRQANGSLIESNGKVVGSSLIGQHFSDPKYFWSRPSATAAFAYDAAASTGSNRGPLNPALKDAVQAQITTLTSSAKDLPVDMVTTSGSGLDPHISPNGARQQVARVARARGMEPAQVQVLVEAHTEGRFLSLLGEARVNVLELNLDLDEH